MEVFHQQNKDLLTLISFQVRYFHSGGVNNEWLFCAMDVVASNNEKKKETKTPKCLLMSDFLLVILLVSKWFRMVSIFRYFCMFRMLLPSSVTQHCDF